MTGTETESGRVSVLSGLTLSHYPREAGSGWTFDADRVYAQPTSLKTFDKPAGFWVSVDGEDDWPAFLDTWDPSYKEYRAAVQVREDANVLRLMDAEDLDVFTDLYGMRPYPGTALYDNPIFHNRGSLAIDWCRIAARYDGIVIAPYVWRRRLELSWYSGWDCQSGCIWNLNAIESVSEVARHG